MAHGSTHGSTNEKRQAHELIERLPATQLSAVVGLLEAMLDPVSRAIARAPVDDEPSRRKRRKRSRKRANGRSVTRAFPTSRFLAELGINEEEIELACASSFRP